MSNSKNSSVLSKFIQLVIAAFIAKGLGFVREMVLAYFYGASAVSDVYVAVQNIPSVIFALFGVAVTTGFIPLYTEVQVKKGKQEADKFANNVFNIFLIFSSLLTVLDIVFSRQLVDIFAGGFTGSTYDMCNKFAKIIMPTSIAIVLVYVYNAYLQIEGHFNQNSIMNVPYNVSQIVFIAIGFYAGKAYLLAFGLLIASYSQLVYLHILTKKKTEFSHTASINIKDPLIKEMLILVGPVFVSTAVNQVNSIVDKALASTLKEGSVAALNYSYEVANIVTQVVILSLTTILYPRMTELFAKDNKKEQTGFTARYINVVSVMVLPMSAMMFFFSEEIVQILFERGAFNQDTVIYVSDALKLYAMGIAGASFRDAFNKIFYSMKNTVTPMINGIIAVGANIGLNFLLIKKYEYLGLAFATSVSSTICTVLMFIQLCIKMKELNIKSIILELIKSSVATAGMVVTMILLNHLLPLSNSVLRCLAYGLSGAIVFIILSIIVKEDTVLEMFKIVKRKIKG
ncbi:MAG: murein biosynthesis integral membrane protein MurJ [Eubacterium sp.]